MLHANVLSCRAADFHDNLRAYKHVLIEEALTSQPRLGRAERQSRSSICRAAEFYEGLRNYENILMEEGGDGEDSDEDDGQPNSDSSER